MDIGKIFKIIISACFFIFGMTIIFINNLVIGLGLLIINLAILFSIMNVSKNAKYAHEKIESLEKLMAIQTSNITKFMSSLTPKIEPASSSQPIAHDLAMKEGYQLAMKHIDEVIKGNGTRPI